MDRRQARRGGSRKQYFFQSRTAAVRKSNALPVFSVSGHPPRSPAAGGHRLSRGARHPVLTGIWTGTGITKISVEVLLLQTPRKETTALLITEGVSYCEAEMQFISGK